MVGEVVVRWSGKWWSNAVVGFLSKMHCGGNFLTEKAHNHCYRSALLQGQGVCRDCAFGLEML